MTDTITEFARIEVKQNRGPTLIFEGREIASTEFETRGNPAMNMCLEVFETRGGALVAVSSAEPVGKLDGFEDVRAVVVDPIEDKQAMQFAVMDFFDWSDRARSMMRKRAKWSFKQVVA